MTVLFDVLKCLIRGKNELILILIWSSHPLIYSWPLYIKPTNFEDETGYNKNNNFENRRIWRTCALGAQKNCLIETLLLNA